jgi:hypothetical protein
MSTFAQVLWGANSEEKANWLHEQLHQLKTSGATPVLTTLRQVASQQAERPELTGALAYLEKRTAHMQYPTFQAAGWPIGDGAVESANKLVVEARLKGSGMHWARPNVDPMLALRNIACNDRWAEAWPQITATLRQQAQQRTTQRRHQRRFLAATVVVQPATLPSPPPTRRTAHLALHPNRLTHLHHGCPWRPPAEHPWRRMPIGRGALQTIVAFTYRKTLNRTPGKGYFFPRQKNYSGWKTGADTASTLATRHIRSCLYPL